MVTTDFATPELGAAAIMEEALAVAPAKMVEVIVLKLMAGASTVLLTRTVAFEAREEFEDGAEAEADAVGKKVRIEIKVE